MNWRTQGVTIFLLWNSLSGLVGSDEIISIDDSSTFKPKDDQIRIAKSVNDFGYKLTLKMMEEDPSYKNNIITSPACLAGLLAMTLLGSTGKTYDELADTLGFSTDILANRQNHEQFGELLRILSATTNDSSSRTIYADAVFVDGHTHLRKVYTEYLRQVYLGEAFSADFQDKDKAKSIINDWVKNNTKGVIEDFLQNPLPVTTKVVLLSALYFSGQWEKPFVPEYTAKMQFKKLSHEHVTADLMLNFDKFKYYYAQELGLQIIAFPYNNSQTAMYVIKPRLPNKLTLPELMKTLDYTKIDELINKMEPTRSVVRFPKMEISSKVGIEGSLKAIGLKSIFSPVNANFALMVDCQTVVNKTEEELILRINTGEVEKRGLKEAVNSLPNPGVYIDSVMHNVKITINEFGTEAVAVASGVLARSAEPFYADSPFYMFIRDENTKLVTFSAVIYDPTLQG